MGEPRPSRISSRDGRWPIPGWSVLKSAMTGHPLWFQVTGNSVAHAQEALDEATRRGSKQEVLHLRQLQEPIEAHAGQLVAVGRITGSTVLGRGVDDHFRGRAFAPVSDLTPLRHPVPTGAGHPLNDLSPFAAAAAQRTNRLVASDAEYRDMLSIVESAGNQIPQWAKVKIDMAKDWMDVANDVGAGFVDETRLAGQFGIPLLRALSDNGRVAEQVHVQPDSIKKRTRWKVDAVVTVGGSPLPVEFKLSKEAEPDLAAQLDQYTGPAELSKKTAKRITKWRTEHPYVLVVDGEGAFLFRSSKLDPSVPQPLLKRGGITK